MNSVPVIFHRLASREYRKARDWYEDRQAGLGAAFAAEVNRAVERIGEAPERWPTFRKNYRFLLVDRFPTSSTTRSLIPKRCSLWPLPTAVVGWAIGLGAPTILDPNG